MNISKKTEKQAKEAKKMIEGYLWDSYLNYDNIQIFTNRIIEENRKVAATYIQTHSRGKKRGYYLGKNKQVFHMGCWIFKKEEQYLEKE